MLSVVLRRGVFHAEVNRWYCQVGHDSGYTIVGRAYHISHA